MGGNLTNYFIILNKNFLSGVHDDESDCLEFIIYNSIITYNFNEWMNEGVWNILKLVS